MAAGAAVAAGSGSGGQPAEIAYPHDRTSGSGGKDTDWSVFSASSFNISPKDTSQSSQNSRQQQQQHWQHERNGSLEHHHQQQSHSQESSPTQQHLSATTQPPLPQLGPRGLSMSSAEGTDDISRVSLYGGGGSREGGSGPGSISSDDTAPPLNGRTSSVSSLPATIGSLLGGVGMSSKAVGSPASGGVGGVMSQGVGAVAGAVARLSIVPDESANGVSFEGL